VESAAPMQKEGKEGSRRFRPGVARRIVTALADGKVTAYDEARLWAMEALALKGDTHISEYGVAIAGQRLSMFTACQPISTLRGLHPSPFHTIVSCLDGHPLHRGWPLSSASRCVWLRTSLACEPCANQQRGKGVEIYARISSLLSPFLSKESTYASLVSFHAARPQHPNLAICLCPARAILGTPADGDGTV